MDEEQRRLKRYKLMFARFNWMEQRYHTWMNYYSLFNGALLVAYCTILVSTGKIVEVEGNISIFVFRISKQPKITRNIQA